MTVPLCSGCTYGKMTRRPWRTKAPYNATPKVASAPGQCVSVDQLDATVPGLIAQIMGIPTTKRYNYAMIFVDHFSKLGYVHLQQTLMSDDTVKAKKAFENYTATYNVKELHYHADNGCFADNAFYQDLQDNNQSISFCVVNAHWQNGVAEKWIRDLTENARAMSLFAQRRSPDAITMNLWPYASSNGKHDLQLCTITRKEGIPPRIIQLNTHIAPVKTFSSFRLPCLCPSRTIATKAKDQKMGREGSNRGIPWPIATTCKVRHSCPKPDNRECFTAISRAI
jgi:hypothetical protein